MLIVMRNDVNQTNKKLSEKEILNKLSRFCAFQERAVSDLINYLKKYRLGPGQRDTIIRKLITEGFVNEERFAKTYMLGKLRNNQWGRIKIIRGLRGKVVDEEIISKVIGTLDEEEYIAVIDHLIKKKGSILKDEEIFIRKHKIARYMMYKGFEGDIVWEQINKSIGC